MTRVIIFILSVLSVALLAVSFFAPPFGVIDNSVLAAVGEIFGFSALLTGLFAIERGTGVKLTHGKTVFETNNETADNSN